MKKRTQQSIRNHASKLEVKYNTHFWTDYENDVILKYYPSEGPRCVKRLKNRSKQSVTAQASKLGIKCMSHYWSDEDDNIIKKYYPIFGRVNKQWMKLISLHTESEILGRAKTLNLKSIAEQDMSFCSNRLICIETGLIFKSQAQASKKYSISPSQMTKYFHGKLDYCGTLPDGTKLHWKYVEDDKDEK